MLRYCTVEYYNNMLSMQAVTKLQNTGPFLRLHKCVTELK